MTNSRTVPVLECPLAGKIRFKPSSLNPNAHPLDDPQLDMDSLDSRTLQHLRRASEHVRADRLVAIPTETVYGLGANSLSPAACRKVYQLKGRPSDNPLIVHIASLNMLHRLVPTTYTLSPLYSELVDSFWPGPLTLLFPNRNPPPKPAVQTLAIRFPQHELARALIMVSDCPISAPSANSSGRPSPTRAEHVFKDLGERGAGIQEGEEILGCILDGGPTQIGLESTVVDGLAWNPNGGVLKILRPGGLGVEAIEKVVCELDTRLGSKTTVWVYGRDAPLSTTNGLSQMSKTSTSISTSTSTQPHTNKITPSEILNPSTPGMKYKHYSPSIPVYLLYPGDRFTTQSQFQPQSHPIANQSSSAQPVLFINKEPTGGEEIGSDRVVARGEQMQVDLVLRQIVQAISTSRSGEEKQEDNRRKVRLGLMAFNGSKLGTKVHQASVSTEWEIRSFSLGNTVEDAARGLFSGMLELEGKRDHDHTDVTEGVDAILIEATNTYGLGLAFMERAGKAVGGGGGKGGLGLALGSSVDESGCVKRFLVDVD